MWEMVKDGNRSKCWLDLSEIGKIGKERYDWMNSIGCKIKIRYLWCKDEMEERWFEIVDYNTKTRKLSLKWNDKVYEIGTSDLLNGHFGNIFDKVTLNFKYEIGDTVNGLTIIDRYYKKNERGHQKKYYKYQCQKKHEHEIVEEALKRGRGCGICTNQKVLEGYNDLATTHRHLVQYFKNPDDAKKYTAHSDKKVTFVCPFCKKEKTMSIRTFVDYGLACSNCSDGVSIPEKYLSNILHLNNCNFKHQLSKVDFDWIGNYKYDFYLLDYNIIIETHGEQHYKEKSENSNWDSLEDVQKNDDDKLKLAQENGYELNKNYFVIDCSNNDFEILTEQVKNTLGVVSKLYNIDFSTIDYKECYIKSQTSIFNIVVDITNNNPEFNQQQIADELKEKYGYQLCVASIRRYLKKSNKLGLTNYTGTKKAVICLNTDKFYESTHEAERKTGINNISACCNGKYKSVGVINGKPAVWMYLDDYKKLSKEEIEKIKNQKLPNGGRRKAVIGINIKNPTITVRYESIHEAKKDGFNNSRICQCANGKYKSHKGYYWYYEEDYLYFLESLK